MSQGKSQKDPAGPKLETHSSLADPPSVNNVFVKFKVYLDSRFDEFPNSNRIGSHSSSPRSTGPSLETEKPQQEPNLRN